MNENQTTTRDALGYAIDTATALFETLESARP